MSMDEELRTLMMINDLLNLTSALVDDVKDLRKRVVALEKGINVFVDYVPEQ